MLFNAYEKRGILIILLIVCGVVVIPRHFRSHRHDLFFLPVVQENDSIFPAGKNRPYPPPAIQKREMTVVELNTADSATLVKIRGIGPYYARKIIAYRERLGGYCSVEQLKELNMKYFDVDSSRELFRVNPELVICKDLDSLSFKEMLRHPYLEYEDVQLIFGARKQYGHLSYRLLEEKKVLPPRILKKIKPYFR